jgi:cell division protein DivIC
MKNFLSNIKFLRNKYVIAVIAFILWICFFDRNDMLTQFDRKRELQKLETSKEYYQSEIVTIKKDLSDLENDPAILEKFAREKFFLKRPNEDVFIVEDSVEIKK